MPIVGEWNLVAVITQITKAGGVVSRDTARYDSGYTFIFNEHGVYNIAYQKDGVTKEGAGTWFVGEDGKVTVLNGFDDGQELYVANKLTNTDLELYNVKVSDTSAIEVWLNLKK